jgi:diguanylate cyclase (GGDEF)-like protein
VPRGAGPRSLYRDGDGSLWLSTSDAVFRHRPGAQHALPSLPAPRVELGQGSRPPLPLAPGATVGLGTAPLRVSLRFSAAVFVAAEEVRFRSRLTPLERAWSAWSDNPMRELTYVPGGDYVLEVQAQDMFDRTSEVTRVALHLDWPWYQRTWALALYVSLVAAAVALLIRLRERRLHARAARLENLVRERTRELEAASVTDQLTGLNNRHFFDTAVRQLLDQGRAVLAALIDVDHFKRINDSRGHEVGDRVLQAVARRLVDAVPRAAILFRWGGEEFLLLMALHDGAAEAGATIAAVLGSVGDAPVELAGGDALTVTCSIGWDVAHEPDDVSMREALRRADRHLYAAKHSGRDRAHGPEHVRVRREAVQPVSG